MRFIQDTTLTVKLEKAEAFQEWYRANKGRLEAGYPEGTSMLGIFFTVFGPGEGEVHVLEILDSYAALDRIAAYDKEHPDNRTVEAEFASFIDWSHGATRTNLLKDMVDLTIGPIPTDTATETVLA